MGGQDAPEYPPYRINIKKKRSGNGPGMALPENSELA